MPGADVKLRPFLRKAIHGRHEEGELRRVTLHHVDATGAHRVVESWIFGEDPDGDDEPSEAMLLAEIASKSEEHADGWPGVNRYLCAAYFGDSEKSGLESGSWLVRVRADFDDVDGPTEPRNQAGAFAQHMRFTESMMKHTLGVQTEGWRQMARTVEQQGAMLETLLKDRQRLLESEQEMRDRSATRNLDVRRAIIEQDRERDLYEMFSANVPAVLGKMAQHVGVPLSLPGIPKDPRTEAIKRVLGTLKPQQLQALKPVLDPMQWTALTQAYESFAKEHEQETEDRRKKDDAALAEVIRMGGPGKAGNQ